jgi:uncharacterized protein DUF2846
MRRLLSWAFALLVFAQLGGWLSVPEAAAQSQPAPKAAAEPQSAQQGPRLARLYFLREKGYSIIENPIKINGKQVGIVTKGSYISVSRPAGRYRITCVNSLSADFETEVNIEAGRTYYFGIGVPQTGPPVQNLVNQAFAGSSGRQLPGASFKSGFSGVALYQIDPAEGAGIVRQMKPR